MPRRDLPRKTFGEMIEEMFAEAVNAKHDYLDNARVALEADGVVSVRCNRVTGRPLYMIRVSRVKED